MAIELTGRSTSRAALVFSLGCLLVPVAGALQFSAAWGEVGAFLWLFALIPAFTMAYYRGWRGITLSMTISLSIAVVTYSAVLLLDRPLPGTLLGVLVVYLATTLGIGWLAETLHRDRAEVEDMAFTDLLTRLPNRRHARLFLENEFAAAERGRQLSIVLFDLDHFKNFNDTYGHSAGDELLAAFGGILEKTTRRMDLSGRFGGEEFVSILTSTDTEGALVFADRIRESLHDVVLTGGARATVSGGVATYHSSMRSPDELLAAADTALYEAKDDGRNRIRLFGRTFLESALPSPEGAEVLLHRVGGDPPPYPREARQVGRSRPSLELMPHQITGFGGGRAALVVEDDPQVRDLVEAYLCAEGFQVSLAGDVPSGVVALDSEFDVLVVDIRLPGLSGTELIRASKERWPATQAIVITGVHDATVAEVALRAGADGYLVKPFGMPDLRRHLAEGLKRRDRALGRSRVMDEAGQERARLARRAALEGATALVRAAEARDPFSAQHGERVSRYADVLAAKLDPIGHELDRVALELGCRFHDVGKVGVEDRLLNKTGRLEAHERSLMEQHTTIGRSLLSPLIDDETALSVVTWHHERWDGTGYPDGLSGASIPLAARVASVTDALAAMTCARPHRPAHSWDGAIETIIQGGGTSYDPRVVDAVAGCLPELEGLYHELGASS